MNKVYVIRFEDMCSGEVSSGICYGEAYTTLEKAKEALQNIKESDIEEYDDSEVEYDIEESDMELCFNFYDYDDYNKYEIIELEVK